MNDVGPAFQQTASDPEKEVTEILAQEAYRIAENASTTLKRMRAEDPARAQLIHEPLRPTKIGYIDSDPICVYGLMFSSRIEYLASKMDNLHVEILDQEDRLRGYIEVASAEWLMPDPRQDESYIGCFRLHAKLPD